MNRNYMNKRCPACDWSTHSSISYDYVCCPMCAASLYEYDMRKNLYIGNPTIP